ncbi:hypothetical protein AcW2_001301 [Taiwanofungus camphoratus]|nr:hypothetical protein AcW2_001301 [Antrodia cinnamomea]
MTIQHIVLGKLKPASALPAPTEEIYAIARTMLASVPGVTNLHVGAPLSTPATFNQGYDFALAITFADLDTFM